MVLTSGGAKGAYGVGVMKALFTGASPATGHVPIDPEIYSGSSVGAYGSAVLGCLPGVPAVARIEYLEQIWLTRIAASDTSCGNGVFRIRGLPVQSLSPACLMNPLATMVELAGDAAFMAKEGLYHVVEFARSDLPPGGRFIEAIDISAFFDSAPLLALVKETVDLQGLLRSGKQVSVVASRWTDGKAAVYNNLGLSMRPDFSPIMASMAIPGIFPAVPIDGIPYVDGGLAMSAPLKPAIDGGAEVIYLLYVDPFEASDAPPLHSTFDIMAQVFSILASERVKSDLRHAQRVNDAIDLLAGRRVTGDVESAAAATAEVRAAPGPAHRKVIIHIFKPLGQVGTGGAGTESINFSYENISALIDLGFREAVEHDCAQAGCVLTSPAAALVGSGVPLAAAAQKGR
jgi:predicted acylesterase/phospholipase RssA